MKSTLVFSIYFLGIALGSSLAIEIKANFEFAGTAEGKVFVAPILPEEQRYGVTWQEALQICSAAGYKLATIESSVQNEVVRNFITKDGVTSLRWSWIDGASFIDRKNWFSINTGQNLTFTDFVQGRPIPQDDHYSVTCRCLRFSYNSMESGWWDVACDDKYNVICETPVA